MALSSVRSRVLLGAALWTVGLFVIAGIGTTAASFRHPYLPYHLHSFFAHAALSWTVAIIWLLLGFWQMQKGLRPLERLRAQIAAMQEGHGRRVEGHYPTEVQPLVDDLNALLDHRERTVARALAKAGDLAHGLKTPLAVLAQESERLGAIDAPGCRDAAATMAQQIDRMRRQMDYHLAQARAAASGAAPGTHCSVLESAEGLSRTMLRVHADRGLDIQVHVDPGHAVRAEREDLDEMLGNLLDNACKWGRARIAVTSASADGLITITVDDDGPGVDPSMREQVLKRGVRADEASSGSGLGLAIVRDLAELYGGSISLGGADAGGLRARLHLPRA